MKKTITKDSRGRDLIIWDSHTCHFCNHDRFPNGRLILPEDKDAYKTSSGDWMCGKCVEKETIKNLYKLNE